MVRHVTIFDYLELHQRMTYHWNNNFFSCYQCSFCSSYQVRIPVYWNEKWLSM